MRGHSISSLFPGGSVIALTVLTGTAVWYAAAALFTTPAPAAVAMALFLAVSAIAAMGFWRRHAGDSFGIANSITFFRAALIAFLISFAVEPPVLGAAVWWLAAATAAFALLLDGVDGWVARKTGRMSAFGARFDMETDALAGLVLCAVIWRAELAGAWVFLIGGMRYVFVAAGWIAGWLRNPLPPRQRRRAVCAMQGCLLVGCLVPALPQWAAVTAAAVALTATTASFLADVLWLFRNRPSA